MRRPGSKPDTVHRVARVILWGVAWVALCAATPTPAQERPSEGPATALEALVRDAIQSMHTRYARPIGHVAERRRGRVYVVVDGTLPKKGDRLLAFRPLEDLPGDRERQIATLQVESVKGGLVECKEVERTSRKHAEKGDRVRLQRQAPRVLLAPCVAQVAVPSVVPQVIGEWLREALLGRSDLQVVEEVELERAAEAAFWSGSVSGFLSGMTDVDEVLYPVLLQTPGKLVLNLEYFSVERGRATHVDVVSAPQDEMTVAWLRARTNRGTAPPGFRLLTTQVFPWRLTALARSSRGLLLGVTRDSVHVLEFRYPGLRPTASIHLGQRRRVRREPYAWVLSGAALGHDMQDAGWVLSDERDPRALHVRHPAEGPRVEVVENIEASDWFESWWPPSWGPLPLAENSGTDRGSPQVLAPAVGDVDGDGRIDVLWSNPAGVLFMQRGNARTRLAFRGYGDVKSVQPAGGAGTRAVVWLTDPVCCGQADRLHATQLIDDELRSAWSSPPFSGTVEALASCDLNGDDAYDLVVAERDGARSKLYVFLALPGEQTTARGMELTGSPQR